MENRTEVQRPLPGRPRDPAKGDSILRATIELLRESGYDALSIEAVAQRAGVSRPTIYRRYQNKTELVIEVVGELANVDWQSFEGELPDPDGNLELDIERLLRILASTFDTLEEEGIALGFLAALIKEPPLAKRFFTQYLEGAQQHVRAVFQAAALRGDIAYAPLPEVVLSMLVGTYVYHRFVIGNEFGDEERRIAARVVARGLAAG